MNTPPDLAPSPVFRNGLRSGSPRVQLVNAFRDPFKNALATARTCYSSKGIISDDQVTFPRFTELAKSIYEAGHHTTLQHAHFQFAIENVSRHAIWSFLHSHPFYNSEQVSQRYVEVKRGAFVIPDFGDPAAQSLYELEMERQVSNYRDLIDLLTPPVAEAFFERFPHRRKKAEEYDKEIKKKAQEVARYVLPIATTAYLYHTISGITLLRYYRIAKQLDTPTETMMLVEAMVNALLDHDPDYAIVLEAPLGEEEFPETEWIAGIRSLSERDERARDFRTQYDGEMQGAYSRLIDYKINAESTLARSVREVLGASREALSDLEAIRLALDPSRNSILGETLVLTTQTKLSRAMHNVHYTFQKHLSHAADSQDQRHRMTPGSRPILHLQLDSREPDYITPIVLGYASEQVQAKYREAIEQSWQTYHRLLEMGVRQEFAEYVLPNATSVRFTESSDLLSLHHKHAMRLCYNAQEEIWRASVEEAEQIRNVHPTIGRFLLPPCGLRDMADVRPVCPEGDRFCGVKVWKIDLSEYHRVI